MTDLEKFLELYRSVGIEPEIEKKGDWTDLRLESDEKGKILGYSGFFTVITFDENGRFKDQGIWE